MILTTRDIDPSSRTSLTTHSHRRLSRALFARLPIGPIADDLPGRRSGLPDGAETKDSRITTSLSREIRFFGLSSDLRAVPERLTKTETLQAVGFADSEAESVGIDVARWTRPPAPELDQVAWRRVFTWIVGADENLSNVSILEPPTDRGGQLSGAYGYDAGGVPGYGILRIAVAADGAWQICDCWGNATDAERIETLAGWSVASRS